MTRVRLGVIADDLTGAADSGVQFAENGFRTLVLLEPDAEAPPEAAAADVLVINTGSRLGPEAVAERSTAVAIGMLVDAGCDRFFLKVDSALRGYVGECVRAALSALPGRVALVAPAYPRQGRVTRGGTQFSDGVPVAEADAGRDGVSPARQSHLPSLLRAAGIATVQATDYTGRRLGTGPTANESAIEAVVFDAVDDAALTRPLRVAAQLHDRVIYVGTAGLARAVAAELAGGAGHVAGASATGGTALADQMDGAAAATTAGVSLPQRDEGGAVLTVSGSLKEVSRRQVAYARAAGARTVSLTAGQLLAPGGSATLAESAVHHLQRARHVIMTVEETPGASPSATEDVGVGVRLAAALGDAAERAVRATGADDLILNGGDTALAVCRSLGIHALWLSGEALAGVPAATPLGGIAGATPVGGIAGATLLPAPLQGMRILSKSGGFGTDETLQRAAEWFGGTRKVGHV